MAIQKLISIPVAVHTPLFKWQLDLFWYNHQLTYYDASERARAVIIRRNYLSEPRPQAMEWDLSVPHHMCESVFDYPRYAPLATQQGVGGLALPLNIQLGVQEILTTFTDEEQVIEVNDCDMFHFRQAPPMDVPDDTLYVSDIYENWHLQSLGQHRNVIERYFENDGKYYNGGFVPIIGKVKTFRRIMYEWIAVHEDILKNDWPELIKWWAGMYALQAACEKARVKMVAKDYCYIPGANQLKDSHYISHYSIDKKFNKKTFPVITREAFESNVYYDRIAAWLPGYMAKNAAV